MKWLLYISFAFASTLSASAVDAQPEPVVDPNKDPMIIDARTTLREKMAAREEVESSIKKLTTQLNLADADLLEIKRAEAKIQDEAVHGRVDNEQQQLVELKHRAEKCVEKKDQLKSEIQDLKPRLAQAEAAEKTARDALNLVLEPYAKVKADAAKREQLQKARVFKLKNGKEFTAISVVETDDGYTIKDADNHFHTFSKSDLADDVEQK